MRTQLFSDKSVPRTSIHHWGLTSITTTTTLRDSSSALHEFSRQALQYYIILDGRLSRDTTFDIRGQSAHVYRGTLSLKRKGLVRAVRGSSRAQEQVLKVMFLLSNFFTFSVTLGNEGCNKEFDSDCRSWYSFHQGISNYYTFTSLTLGQDILREVHIWSKLCHEHVLPFLGITTDLDLTISIVTPWMEKGNASEYVQDSDIDPRPLVSSIPPNSY